MGFGEIGLPRYKNSASLRKLLSTRAKEAARFLIALGKRRERIILYHNRFFTMERKPQRDQFAHVTQNDSYTINIIEQYSISHNILLI